MCSTPRAIKSVQVQPGGVLSLLLPLLSFSFSLSPAVFSASSYADKRPPLLLLGPSCLLKTALPDKAKKSFGAGARTFRKAASIAELDSTWTDTPAEKKKRAADRARKAAAGIKEKKKPSGAGCVINQPILLLHDGPAC